ncbi:Inner membrane protein ygbE [Salmonella enterica subsp. arizonae]|uniref:Inner membrane protein ygbE n=1 Tax=Salmonella enterica subsp. arizonae TaxID=59203 RepID=A0A2X4TIC2_SALER|nr:Inner membrane protein ygbE [Salmonella enterica subsp. arizonae]
MRNSHNITFTRSDAFIVDDDTTSSLPGAVVGFVSWLLALGIPFLLYGPNTLFFFSLYLALFPRVNAVSVIIGIALHLLVKGKLLFSIMFTLLAVGALFGALFIWLLG